MTPGVDAEAVRARDAAVRIARDAGHLVMEGFGRLASVAVRYKGEGEKDLVTDMDERAQELIVEALAREFPSHGVLAEEETTASREAPYRWVIDPIDGTTNFVHGYPVFCVSIALEREGVPIVGVVHAPALGELFVAARGTGATLNGNAIRVSDTALFARSLLATGFACIRNDLCADNVALFSSIVRQVHGIRRAGSAALDLAYVAAGRFDGFWELNLNAWDTGAGVLLVREAGGEVSDFEGEGDFVRKKEIVATNGALHEPLLAAIRRVRSAEGRPS